MLLQNYYTQTCAAGCKEPHPCIVSVIPKRDGGPAATHLSLRLSPTAEVPQGKDRHACTARDCNRVGITDSNIDQPAVVASEHSRQVREAVVEWATGDIPTCNRRIDGKLAQGH